MVHNLSSIPASESGSAAAGSTIQHRRHHSRDLTVETAPSTTRNTWTTGRWPFEIAQSVQSLTIRAANATHVPLTATPNTTILDAAARLRLNTPLTTVTPNTALLNLSLATSGNGPKIVAVSPSTDAETTASPLVPFPPLQTSTPDHSTPIFDHVIRSSRAESFLDAPTSRLWQSLTPDCQHALLRTISERLGELCENILAAVPYPVNNPAEQERYWREYAQWRDFQQRQVAKTAIEAAATAAAARRKVFDIFKALMDHPEILMYVTTKHLAPPEFLGLYVISKDFHWIVNTYKTAYIKSACRAWAPLTAPAPTCAIPPSVTLTDGPVFARDIPSNEYEDCAAEVLPFNMYRQYCIFDPACHKPSLRSEIDPGLALRSHNRNVPGFRYLFHLVQLTDQARTILLSLYCEHGMRFPQGTLHVMLKLAFLMYSRRNAVRIGLIHNEEWLTDRQIWLAENLLMKVDMAFTDPRRMRVSMAKHYRTDAADFPNFYSQRVLGRGLREMATAFPHGWSVLAKILTHQRGYRSPEDMERMYTEWKFTPTRTIVHFGPGLERINGVLVEDCGWLDVQWDRGLPTHRLMPIDELLVREGERRQLRIDRVLVETAVYGWSDGDMTDGGDDHEGEDEVEEAHESDAGDSIADEDLDSESDDGRGGLACKPIWTVDSRATPQVADTRFPSVGE